MAALEWGGTSPARGGPQHSAWLMYPGQKLPLSAWPRSRGEGHRGTKVNLPPPLCPDEVTCFFFLKDWLSAPHPPWSLSQVLEECPPTSIWDRASGHRVWAGLPLCLEVVFLLGFLCLIKWRFSFKLANWVSESLFHEMCHQKKKRVEEKKINSRWTEFQSLSFFQ